MVLKNYLVDNFVMLYELVGLIIILRISAHLVPRMKRLTIMVIGLLFLESVVFALERWSQSFDSPGLLRPLMAASISVIYTSVLLVLSVFTEKKLSKQDKLLSIPWLCCIPLFYTSQWTHLVFWFTEDNELRFGPLRYLSYFLFGFYLMVFLVRNLRFFRRYARMNSVAARYIVIGSVVGVTIYFCFAQSRDYSTIFTSAILLYYVMFYIHMAKIDPLTRLLNRQSYYQDIKNGTQNITGIISIDMNEMKYINDTAGHHAGDVALKTVATAIRRICPDRCPVYRMGGDEFLVLCRGLSESEIRDVVSKMRKVLSCTTYVCAFGYAVHSQGRSLEETAREADARMFEDKAEIKRRIVENGGILHSRH